MDGDLQGDFQMPGAGFDFRDVTEVFVQAAAELEPNELLFMENFTLHESMSALEIGEPRLDTGLIVQEQIRPPFNPLTPLLPEELCWILDRMLAFEMEFHAGNFLAHTVHTLLYVHHLPEIDPDITFIHPTLKNDPSRPIELVTLLLRFAVQALLKCCDLSWRVLEKAAHDTEDWQSDKCDVSLLEGLPALFILLRLDGAVEWVSQCTTVPNIWQTALKSRLLLRKSILQIMNSDPCRDRNIFQQLVLMAKGHLRTVESNPSPDLGPDSPAQLAFDPYIGRRLQTATPIRVISPPSFSKTFKRLDKFLDGLFEVGMLEPINQLTTWETVGNLRSWLPETPLYAPYIRSLTQATFYDGVLVLNKHPFEWMVNQFFEETIGIDFSSILSMVHDRSHELEFDVLFKRAERSLNKLIIPHIRALWNNPPRKRRHFMKALLEWHNLYDILVQIRDNLQDLPMNNILTRLPDTALSWRLSVVREVVLSGFQLELYSDEERSFAYWYSARIIDAHLNCCEHLLTVVTEGSNSRREMLYQSHFLAALQALCTALFIVSMPLMSFDWTRTKPNFFRRYKWAFQAEYDIFETPVVAQPDLHNFIRECGQIIFDGPPNPSESVKLARSILDDLVRSKNVGGYAGEWTSERMQLTKGLLSVCDNLDGLPDTSEGMNAFDAKSLKWDPAFHPWFPLLHPSSESKE